MPLVLTTDTNPGTATWLDHTNLVPPTQYLRVLQSNTLPTGAAGRLDAGNDLLSAGGTVTVPADGDYILEVVVLHSTVLP
jgi:hypothetical protein